MTTEKPWACWRCNQLNEAWATECGRCGQQMKKMETPDDQYEKRYRGDVLPCPFCGKAPVIMGSGKDSTGLMIHCIGENCPNPSVSYYEHAITLDVWNQRRGNQYLIWSNEHQAWWRQNSAGYTMLVEDAGRYSRDEALKIASDARNGWRAGQAPPEIAISEADVLAHRFRP